MTVDETKQLIEHLKQILDRAAELNKTGNGYTGLRRDIEILINEFEREIKNYG